MVHRGILCIPILKTDGFNAPQIVSQIENEGKCYQFFIKPV